MASTLSGKVALITGASSGIGAATAILFSQRGAKLAITGRREEKLKAVAQSCLKASRNRYEPLVVVGDVTDTNFLEKLVHETIDHYKHLDVLVANAGMLKGDSIESIKLEDYDLVMNTNVRSPMYLQHLCVPHLIKTKGNVVHVSSIAGTRSFQNFLAYCMSKSAIDQLTRCSALELAPKQVRVNSVNPGVIDTEIFQRELMNEEVYTQFLEDSKQTHPLGRHGQSDEVARTIAFLSSDEASFITGAQVPVCGGRTFVC